MLCKRYKIPYLGFKPGKGLTIINYRLGGVIGRKTVIGQRDILCSHSSQSILEIGANTLIGRDSTISAINSVIIEDDVLQDHMSLLLTIITNINLRKYRLKIKEIEQIKVIEFL